LTKCFSEEELDAYLDGEDIPGLPEHARDCGRCGDFLRRTMRLRLMLGEVEMDSPPVELPSRVMLALRETTLARASQAGIALGARARVLRAVWLTSSAVAGYLLSIVILEKANATISGFIVYTGYAGAVVRLFKGLSAGGWTALWSILGISRAALINGSILLVLLGICLAATGARRYA